MVIQNTPVRLFIIFYHKIGLKFQKIIKKKKNDICPRSAHAQVFLCLSKGKERRGPAHNVILGGQRKLMSSVFDGTASCDRKIIKSPKIFEISNFSYLVLVNIIILYFFH